MRTAVHRFESRLVSLSFSLSRELYRPIALERASAEPTHTTPRLHSWPGGLSLTTGTHAPLWGFGLLPPPSLLCHLRSLLENYNQFTPTRARARGTLSLSRLCCCFDSVCVVVVATKHLALAFALFFAYMLAKQQPR